MNAVTAVARDTHNPEVRWRLEEIGAEMGPAGNGYQIVTHGASLFRARGVDRRLSRGRSRAVA